MAFLVSAVFALAWGSTLLVLRYATTRRLLDVPNFRSSHTRETPRGGGIAIVVSTCAGLALLPWMTATPTGAVIALVGSGAIVALIGFLDDHGYSTIPVRLGSHVVAAAWLLAWLGGTPPMSVMGFTITGWLGGTIAIVYVVWLINLTNFMDGIDALASIEAITVCLGAVSLYAVVARPLPWEPIILASATAGFLIWNWPPARIFMGDTGSGFLGVMLAALSLQAARAFPPLFWGWLILVATFVTDASVTLIRRILRGDRFYEAHRSHAYQYMARRLNAHRPVTLTAAAINLCWLWPIALLVSTGWIAGPVGTAIAYAPLIALAWRWRAGVPESL